MSNTERLKSVDEIRAIGRELKKNTNAALQSDLKRFLRAGFSLTCTPETLCRYLTESAQGLHGRKALSPTSLTRFLSSFRKAYSQNERLRHRACPANSPEVAETIAGLYQLMSAPVKQAKAISMDDLVSLCERLKGMSEDKGQDHPQRLAAARDRAIIVCAFWRGLRADTIGSIRMADVYFEDQVLCIRLPREKQRRGLTMTIAEYQPDWILSPCDAMKDWLRIYNDPETNLPDPDRDNEGSPLPAVLFPRILRKGGIRSLSAEMDRHSITAMLKERLPLVGIQDVNGYSAHSFRHSLGSWGGMYLPADVLMQLGDWKKLSSVQRYLKKNRVKKSVDAANRLERQRLTAEVRSIELPNNG